MNCYDYTKQKKTHEYQIKGEEKKRDDYQLKKKKTI